MSWTAFPLIGSASDRSGVPTGVVGTPTVYRAPHLPRPNGFSDMREIVATKSQPGH